ncbi:MAG: tRNA lysidine(34) synthetase TilS [Proteobacteria bacterium]|nr:tRNA lysidine(34) synthetase TilS [Pseudomonadota bacterium]
MLIEDKKIIKEKEGIKESALYGRFRATLKEHAMCAPGTTVLVAVSGGVDSVVLLRLLVELSAELSGDLSGDLSKEGLTLIACHLNHNLRGAEAVRDHDFAEAYATELGVKFVGETLAPGSLDSGDGSIQAMAREARYAFFARVAKRVGATRIATAHTRSDVVETMLMRFVKGAATGGLGGIRPVRLPFIRPLIDSTRAEIEAFAECFDIGHVEDSSNKSDKYLRNDIRHNLVGLLKERYNPNLLDSLARSARNFERDEEFITIAATDLYNTALVSENDIEVLLNRTALLSAHPAVLSRVLLKATERFGCRADFYSIHVDAMGSLIESENPSGQLDLPGGLLFAREYETVRLGRAASLENVGETEETEATAAPFDIELKIPGRTELFGNLKEEPGPQIVATITEVCETDSVDIDNKRDESTAYFDLASLLEATGTESADLRARSFAPGDRMTPFGKRGEQKLKELLIDAKVPRFKRTGVPLVTVAGTIIWAAGLRRSALYTVTEKTRRLLKLQYLK